MNRERNSMEEQELRAAVCAEFGGAQSSPLVDRRMEEAYASLGGAPAGARHMTQQSALPLRIAKWMGAAAAGMAAAFTLLLGLSLANPALAASLPGMQSIVAFLKGGHDAPDVIVRDGAVNEFMQPVSGVGETASGAEAEQPAGLEITETYFDGSAIVLGLRVTLDEAPEEYRRLVFDPYLTFTTDGTFYTPEYVIDGTGMAVLDRYTGNTFIGAVSLYSTGEQLSLPDSFTLTVGTKDLHALDTKLMVLKNENDPYDYVMKRYEIDALTPVSCPVRMTPDLRKVYQVNETKDGCTLKSVVVTPAWTEVNITVKRDTAAEGTQIVMLPYGSNGKQLEYLSLRGTQYGNQRFFPLVKDETEVVVKFFQKNNKFDPVAEFVVPVDGGYADRGNRILDPDTADEDVVYDPPIPEEMSFASGYAAVPLTLGETFEASLLGYDPNVIGRQRLTFDNIRYYDDWMQAGIATEEMNLPFELKQGMAGPEDYTFVTFDLTVERYDCPEDADSELHLMGPMDFTYMDPGVAVEDYGKQNMVCSEGIAYLEGHGNGFSDYYHYHVEPNTAKTVKVGVLAQNEMIEAGRAVITFMVDDPEKLTEGGYYLPMYLLYRIPPRS